MTDPRHCAAPGCGKPLLPRQTMYCSNQCRADVTKAAFNKRAHFCSACHRPVTMRRSADHRWYPKTCSRYACKEARRLALEAKIASETEVHFPEVKGEIVAEFWRHNVRPKKDYGSIPLRPATHVAKESSIA